MENIEWKEVSAKLSTKHKQWKGLFSREYIFLVMYSIRINSDEDAENLGPYIESNTFMESLSIDLPSLDDIFSVKPKEEKAEEFKKEAQKPKKIRGTLMLVQNLSVSKEIYEKYDESVRINLLYESTNPLNIKIQ